jgi:DNA-directed RNA polymerase II subunit RPB2
MVGSFNCALVNMTAEERVRAGECEYDEGGYFIIKGGEKIIVA